MSDTPSWASEGTLAALERELAYAKQVKPGGQPVNAGRVAAIEAQIASMRDALHPKKAEPAPKPEARRAPKETTVATAPDENADSD